MLENSVFGVMFVQEDLQSSLIMMLAWQSMKGELFRVQYAPRTFRVNVECSDISLSTRNGEQIGMVYCVISTLLKSCSSLLNFHKAL